MKAWWFHPLPDRIDLEARDVPVPEPGPGQLLVRMRAASLNRGELIPGHGLVKEGAAKPAGAEGSGEVVRVGPGVSAFLPGDRVMGRCAGAFAECAVMDHREAMPVPARLSWEEAAGVPLVFLVAYDMLYEQGVLKSGEWLLVTGISSGVGVAALQTAKRVGAKVIGTSGSAQKLERLKLLGLDVAIRTRAPDFARQVVAATGGRGANLAVNNVGGSMFAECVRALGFQGRMATVGYVDGVMKADLDIGALHTQRLSLFGVSNKNRSAEQRAVTVRGFVKDVLPAIADGRISPLLDRVFAFPDLPEARRYMESDAHTGKIAITIP